MKKPFIFAKEITTTVPTACLIEHYQALCKAIQNKDWTEVETVKACLAENIKFGTDVPEQYRMQEVAPSVSSVIATECGYGILLDGNGDDILCAAHHPASYAMSGGVCQCTDKCMEEHGCCPDKEGGIGHIMLENGVKYEMSSTGGSELMDALCKNAEEDDKSKIIRITMDGQVIGLQKLGGLVYKVPMEEFYEAVNVIGFWAFFEELEHSSCGEKPTSESELRDVIHFHGTSAELLAWLYKKTAAEVPFFAEVEDISDFKMAHGTAKIAKDSFVINRSDTGVIVEDHNDCFGDCTLCVNFMLDANNINVDELFGTNVCTDENDDYLNIYVNAYFYGLRMHVGEYMYISLMYADGKVDELGYHMSEAERRHIQKMVLDYVAEEMHVWEELP